MGNENQTERLNSSKKNMLWFRDDQPAINDGGKFPKLFSET